MQFVDRQPKYPGKVLITPENGEPFYATLVRADEPTVEGTPLTAGVLNEAFKEVNVGYSCVKNYNPTFNAMEPFGASDVGVKGEIHTFGNLVVLALNIGFTPTGEGVSFSLPNVPSTIREVRQVVGVGEAEFLSLRLSNDSTVDEKPCVAITNAVTGVFESSEYSFDVVIVYSAK